MGNFLEKILIFPASESDTEYVKPSPPQSSPSLPQSSPSPPQSSPSQPQSSPSPPQSSPSTPQSSPSPHQSSPSPLQSSPSPAQSSPSPPQSSPSQPQSSLTPSEQSQQESFSKEVQEQSEIDYDPNDIYSVRKDFNNTEWENTIYGDFCKQIYKLGEDKKYITILNESITSLESEHDKIIKKNEILLNKFKTDFKTLRKLYDNFLENPSKGVKDDMNKIYENMKKYNIEYKKIYDGIEGEELKKIIDIDTKIIIQKIKANIMKTQIESIQTINDKIKNKELTEPGKEYMIYFSYGSNVLCSAFLRIVSQMLLFQFCVEYKSRNMFGEDPMTDKPKGHNFRRKDLMGRKVDFICPNGDSTIEVTHLGTKTKPLINPKIINRYGKEYENTIWQEGSTSWTPSSDEVERLDIGYDEVIQTILDDTINITLDINNTNSVFDIIDPNDFIFLIDNFKENQAVKGQSQASTGQVGKDKAQVAKGPPQVAKGQSQVAKGQSQVAGTIPTIQAATGKNQAAVGKEKNATGKNQAAVGKEKNATGKNQAAVGKEKNATGKNQAAVGKEENATGKNQAAVGKAENATGKNQAAVGKDENATGKNQAAVGKDENAKGKDENAKGKDENATGKNQAAVGKDENAE